MKRFWDVLGEINQTPTRRLPRKNNSHDSLDNICVSRNLLLGEVPCLLARGAKLGGIRVPPNKVKRSCLNSVIMFVFSVGAPLVGTIFVGDYVHLAFVRVFPLEIHSQPLVFFDAEAGWLGAQDGEMECGFPFLVEVLRT